MTDQATLDAADIAFRHWSAPVSGTIEPGSDAHKAAFCRMLLETHNPYKPAVIDWPKLDEAARMRLIGLPIWDIAVQTEGKARERVLGYAETIADPIPAPTRISPGRTQAAYELSASACVSSAAPAPLMSRPVTVMTRMVR